MTIDPTWLRRRYLDDLADVASIAAEACVNASTIHRALRAAQIPPRGKVGARAVASLDRDWLVQRRGEGASWDAIAREVNVDHTSVLWQAAGYGLYDLESEDPVRYRKAVRAAAKYRRGQSLAQVATAVGVDRRQVTLWLRALGVEIRTPGRRPQAEQGGRAPRRERGG